MQIILSFPIRSMIMDRGYCSNQASVWVVLLFLYCFSIQID